MTSITVKIKVELEEEIEIDIDDLIHQSIEDYMDYVRENPQDYINIDMGFDWEVA